MAGSKACSFLAFILVLIGASMAQTGEQAMHLAGQAASSNNRPGQPIYSLNGAGAGNNGRNWAAGGTAGVGAKVWESRNGRHSVGLAATAGQSFGRFEGQRWRSKPSYGAGAGYSFKFGKK